MQSDSRTLLTSQASSSSSSSQGKPDRLYVGNLSPTVDEYTLIQVFQKYGKITKLDFMFHKSGVLKGKPRGYAFVEFSSKDDALKAMVKLHDRLLRGRKLVVTSASSATPNDTISTSTNKGRRAEPTKTTTLSLLKQSRKPQSAAAQIAAMEAKLAALQSKKPADETYVPGLGIDSKYNAPRPDTASASRQGSASASASGSASPAPEMDLDEEMGLDAATKAADELEREFGLEIAGAGREPVETVPEAKASPVSLPPKPKLDTDGQDRHKDKAKESAGPELKEMGKAMSDTFKKGLAGLPKKPTF